MEPQTSAPTQSRFAFDAITAQRFADFHAANPQVYATLLRFALEAKRAGRTRMSINLLAERLRWHSTVEVNGDEFRVNNNLRPYFARLLMEQEPELSGFFETRKAQADRG
jgi:hypothetical protein